MQQRRLSRVIQTKEQEFGMLVQQTKRRKRIPNYNQQTSKKSQLSPFPTRYIIPSSFFSLCLPVLSVLCPADLRRGGNRHLHQLTIHILGFLELEAGGRALWGSVGTWVGEMGEWVGRWCCAFVFG